MRQRAPVYVLVECAGALGPDEELAEALEQAGIEDALVADDTATREGLWALREGHTEAINAAGVPHKLDVGVPLRAARSVSRRGARTSSRRRAASG